MNTHTTFETSAAQHPMSRRPDTFTANERDDEWEDFLALGLQIRIEQAELVAAWEQRLAVLSY